jgi:hypothetical protein
MSLPGKEASPQRAAGGRSAACVKACEGIPTELLEQGFILRLIAACVHVQDDRVREMLETLALHRLQTVEESGNGRSRQRVKLARPLGRQILRSGGC